MGWVQEVVDLVGKLSFFAIVHEYEQGLYFRRGRAIDKKVRWSKEELEKIVQEERKVIRDNKGVFPLMFSRFYKRDITPSFPEGYKRGLITNLPKHSKRYEKGKVLKPGVYFNVPILDSIVIDFQQEKILNLGNIGVPTIDEESKEVRVSCNLRYQLMDLYRAYTAVHDYESSLKGHTLSILAKHSRGKKYCEWKNPKVIEELEEEVKKELRKIVTEDWGLKIYEIYITHNIQSHFQDISWEGNPLSFPTLPLDNNIIKIN